LEIVTVQTVMFSTFVALQTVMFSTFRRRRRLQPPGILGRAGFFENFHACFSEKGKRFSLKPV